MAASKTRPHAVDSRHLSDLRIVLLGYRYAGKTSSGNTILGKKEFDTVGITAQCVKRQGEVAGRHVTVVEAPGWNLFNTSSMIKDQIKLSVHKYLPRPHALLLVIHVGVDRSFTEQLRISVQEHLELLGARVWNQTIVLFTHGDCLEDTPIEKYIESEGGNLHWLVEKCGNRYHVFNNERRNYHMQVTQLIEKIEEMVAANNSGTGSRSSHNYAKSLIVFPVKRAASYDFIPPSMSGEYRSPNRSLVRSASQLLLPVKKAASYGGLPTSMCGESNSWHSSTRSPVRLASEWLLPMESSASTEFLPPSRSLDPSSDACSDTSSAYSSSTTLGGSGISSMNGSLLSVSSSLSSGYGSLSSRAGSIQSLDSGRDVFPGLSDMGKALPGIPEDQEESDIKHTKNTTGRQHC